MQKKIIALAIAGLSATSAFAADTVTLYGVADAYVSSTSADGKANVTGVNSGGLAASRLGFKGVEDLGSGLKALFVLEYRVELDNSNGAVGFSTSTNPASQQARQQMLGLTGNFGTAVAGTLQTAAYDWAVKFDGLAGTQISPLQNITTGYKIAGLGGHARAGNALAYISPSFNGLTFAVNYALAVEETAFNTQVGGKTTATLASLTYENGPVAVGLTYDKQSKDVNAGLNVGNNAGATTAKSLAPQGLSAGPNAAGVVAAAAASAPNTTDWALGASYNFGVATLKATYQTTKNTDGTNDGTNDWGATNKAYSIAGLIPVSAAGTVIVQYAKSKNDVQRTATADGDAKAWTLAYTHALSKRTTAYAGYTSATVDQTALQQATATAANSAYAGMTSIKTSTILAGLNHKF